MSTPQYGEPPKGPSRMVVSAVPICPFCKNKDHGEEAMEYLASLEHGRSAGLICLKCEHAFNIQALVSRDGTARTYRTVPGMARFPKLPEEMVK